MRNKPPKVVSWVVYKQQDGTNAMCEQSDWEAMERTKPGFYTLIKAGITNEGEAERLARGTSGDSVPRRAHKKEPSSPPPAS